MAYNELISLGGNGIIDILTDDANATASQILSGYTAYVKGKKISGTIPSQGAQTITPSTTNKTITSGRYLSGTQTIKGDSNLVASNIKKGTSIFGVSGTYTSDANAGSGDILSGKTAYVNGNKVTGSMTNQSSSIRTITTSTGNQTLGAFRYYSNYIQIVPGKGYWGSWSWDTSRLQIAQSVLASAIGLTAAKIAKGNTVLGIAGTGIGNISYMQVLKYNLSANSPYPNPERTTVTAPKAGKYRVQVHYNGHDSDSNGKFTVRIGLNGSWGVNQSNNTDLNGTWSKDYTCKAKDQLMVEIGGYFPKSASYVFLYLNSQSGI